MICICMLGNGVLEFNATHVCLGVTFMLIVHDGVGFPLLNLSFSRWLRKGGASFIFETFTIVFSECLLPSTLTTYSSSVLYDWNPRAGETPS